MKRKDFDLYFRPGVSGTTYWAWIEALPAGQTISLPVSLFASPQGFFTGGSRADTDGDGLTDGFELLVSKTNPTNPDSAVDQNGDGQIDAFSELANNGVYDSQEDFEPDNLRNEAEYYLGTNPFRSDSDDDGTNDADEDYNNDGITDYEDYLNIVVTLEPGYHESSVILNTVGTASALREHAGVILSRRGNSFSTISVSVPGNNQLKITGQMFVSPPSTTGVFLTSARSTTRQTTSPSIRLLIDHHDVPGSAQSQPRYNGRFWEHAPPYFIKSVEEIQNEHGNFQEIMSKYARAYEPVAGARDQGRLPRVLNLSDIESLNEDYLRYFAQVGHDSSLRYINLSIKALQEGASVNSRQIKSWLYSANLQRFRHDTVHKVLKARGIIGKFINFLPVGFLVVAYESDAYVVAFEDAFRSYARDLERGEDTTGSAAILAGVCNNLAPGSQNIVLNGLLQ